MRVEVVSILKHFRKGYSNCSHIAKGNEDVCTNETILDLKVVEFDKALVGFASEVIVSDCSES